MKQVFITFGGSFVLASLLLVGCGGGDGKSSSSSQSLKEKFTPPAHVVEMDKQKSIRKYLSSQGVEVKSSSYSQSKTDIYIVGIDGLKYTFYSFDAQTLTLKESFPIDVVGTIDMKNIADEKVAIKVINDDTQSNYTFDVKKGKLEYQNQEKVKLPEELIQEQIGDTYEVKQFMLTPSTMGALVMIDGKDNSRTLWLYGMENPKAPAREYAIFTATQEDSINNIQLLGDGHISYTHTMTSNSNQKHLVTYDYFNKKKIKDSWEGISNDIDIDALKAKIEPQVSGSILDLRVTPSKLGAIVVSQAENGNKNLSLFGLEDIQNPKKEHYILSQYIKMQNLSIKEIQPKGILVFTTGTGNQTITYTYDYFNDKYLKYETPTTGQEKVTLLLRAKRFSMGANTVEVNTIEHLEGDKYLITYHHGFCCGSAITTSVFDVAKSSEKNLSYHQSVPGNIAHNIMIDKDKKRITYTTKMTIYEIGKGQHPADYDMDGDIQHSYNYETGISTRVLPAKKSATPKDNSQANKILKNAIEKAGHPVYHKVEVIDVKVSPSGEDAVVLAEWEEGRSVYLYNIKDKSNPVHKKDIIRKYLGRGMEKATLKDILQDGVARFTIKESATTLNYDYNNDKIVKIETDKTGLDKVLAMHEAEYPFIQQTHYISTSKGAIPVEGNLYIVQYDYQILNRSSGSKTALYDTSDFSEVELSRFEDVDGSHTVLNTGYKTKDFVIDREKKMFTYIKEYIRSENIEKKESCTFHYLSKKEFCKALL